MFTAQDARENAQHPRAELMKEVERAIIEASDLGQYDTQIAVYGKINVLNLKTIQRILKAYGYLSYIEIKTKKTAVLYIHW